jgi:hypothetical protein
MPVRDFTLIIVRLFGLWVLYTCIGFVERFAYAMLPFPNAGPELGRYLLLLNLLSLLLHLAIGLLLVWKPQIVANWVPLAKGRDADLRLSTTNLIFVSFSIVGLVFLITGLASLFAHAAEWAFAAHGPLFRRETDTAGVVIAAFKTVAGLWLLCRSKGLLRGLRWLLQSGRTLGVRAEEESYDKE